MANVGLLVGMKLLGCIDLPDMEFPTAVCAVGNDLNHRVNGRDGNAGLLREYDLARQADRDVFFKGANAQYGSTAGFAVVASKYENKAAFLDLQPLIQRVRASLTFRRAGTPGFPPRGLTWRLNRFWGRQRF